MTSFPRIAIGCLVGLLAGCAAPSMPPASVPAEPPPAWYAPVPHDGSLQALSDWWTALGDPFVVELIASAQQVSGTLASATSRLEQARNARVSAGAALGPSVDGNVQASRGFSQQTMGVATIVQSSVQASWEADLFGGNRAARDAAQARFQGAQAQWHDARVAVAAETADRYVAVRSCGELLAVMADDAGSREETDRLTQLAADAGFQSPANAALARASRAEAAARLVQQRAQCDTEIKALVALTGMAEPVLRNRLAQVSTLLAAPAASVPAVPAELLAQRPDVYAAEVEVAAASANVGTAEAARYPSLQLTGSIGSGRVRAQGTQVNSETWSIGPVTLSVPLFDGGRRRAEADAARARYEEAVALYRTEVREAVREVEQALVSLDSTRARDDETQRAAAGYRETLEAAQARYRSGLGSLIELEDVRRTSLNADMAVVNLRRERLAAWISLYRAMGGGWRRPQSPDAAAAPAP